MVKKKMADKGGIRTHAQLRTRMFTLNSQFVKGGRETVAQVCLNRAP